MGKTLYIGSAESSKGATWGSNLESLNLRAMRLERSDASSDLRAMASGPMARAMG
jgi:hypothetical protein